MTITDGEELQRYANYLHEDRRQLALLRSLRQRYLAADPDRRRDMLRNELPGTSSLTDINTSIRICRDNVQRWERAVTELGAET